MTAKDARVDLKTTKAAKAMLERAAHAAGTTMSAFILDCAMSKAREIVAQSDLIRLTHKESERFIAALQKAPLAHENLKQLFKKHHIEPSRHQEKA